MMNNRDNLRGALLMMIGMAAFTLNDACLKALSDHMPLFQTLFLRGIGNSIVLIFLAMAFGQWQWRHSSRDWRWLGLRSFAEAIAAWLFVTALFNMQLANATAIMQALPIVMTLLGAFVLKERIGWRRIAASLVGFGGVMMIVQPGSDGFNIYSIYALATVATVALRDLAARQMSATVPSIFAAFCSATAVTVFAGIFSLSEEWQPITVPAIWLLAGAMVMVVTGYVMSVMAMRIGEVSFVAQFRYVSLPVGLIAGWAAFGQIPAPLALWGCLTVVASGLFIFRRQRVLEQAD